MTENLTFIDYLRSILGILLFIGLFSLLIPIVSVLVVISLGKLTDWILEKVAPFLSRIVLQVLGITFRTEYHQTKLEDDSILTGNVQTPAIYIVNHASTLDILTILALGIKRVRFVAKWEMQYFPFFFLLGRLTGQIFIKRGNREKAIQTLQNNYAKDTSISPLHFNCTRRNKKT
jgi:1-acyl-sn-glycerol-3-phosphate acyltransferase